MIAKILITLSTMLMCTTCLFAQATITTTPPQPSPTPPPSSTAEQIIVAPIFLSYKEVKDNFGRRVADTFVVVQVAVRNEDKQGKQFLVQDIVVTLDPNQCEEAGSFYEKFDVGNCQGKYEKYFMYPIAYSPTSRQTVLAVANVGKDKNPRNFFFRSLEFAASFSTSLTGFNFIGRDGKAGIGILNGAFLNSAKTAIPDFTAAQMSNVTERTFTPNSIIESQRSEIFNIFIPTDRFFSNDSWKLYKTSTRKMSSESLELKRILQLTLMASAYGVYIKPEGETKPTKPGGGAKSLTTIFNR